VFGREQEIEIGHMSGESNVIYWLRKRHIEPDATLVKQILGAAKATDHLLTEDEVQLIIKEFRASGGGDTSSSATSA
jgi:2-isopropylmalate synthase